ncbi:MAG: type II toxin-antitoxin system HicA family toxin [Candidatus Freyrarchaeum guaymaensis]
MPKIKPLPPQKIIKILGKAGFRILRQKGSHLIMINERGTRIVVPTHPGKEIKPSLIRAIIREAGLKREDFFKLLKEK